MLDVKFEPDHDSSKRLGHVADPILQDALRKSDIVLLPESVTRDGKALFRPGSKDFFDFVTAHVGSKARIEVASGDDEYAEELLHANEIWLPSLLLLVENPLVHEIAIVAAAHYVLDKLKSLGKKDQDKAVVHAKIVVNRAKGTASFTYEGPAASFEAIMTKAIRNGSEDGK